MSLRKIKIHVIAIITVLIFWNNAFFCPKAICQPQSFLAPETVLSEDQLRKVFLEYGLDISRSGDRELREQVDSIIADLVENNRDDLEKFLPSNFNWEQYVDLLKNEGFNILERYIYYRISSGLPIDSEGSSLRDFIKKALSDNFNMATGFFRNGEDMGIYNIQGWVSETEDFFTKLIRAKARNNDLRIRVKSIGGANGSEAYSIAAIIHRCLSEYAANNGFGQSWLEKWDIVIEVYDSSLTLLMQSKIGIYRFSPREWLEIEAKFSKYASYFNVRERKNRLIDVEMPDILKKWIKSVYVDFKYENFETKDSVAVYLTHDSRANLIVSMNFFPYVNDIAREIEGGIVRSFDSDNDYAWLENEDLNLRPVFNKYTAEKTKQILNSANPEQWAYHNLGEIDITSLNNSI